MVHAILLYQQEHSKADVDGTKPLSVKGCSQKTSDSYFVETGKRLELSDSTLLHWVKGGKSKAETNADKGWLLPSEIKQVMDYTVEVSNCGFPLDHHRLAEHVNEICTAQLGPAFPAEGVRKNWTHCFVLKHLESLNTYWTCPLDSVRSQAVNENTNDTWFNIYHHTKTKYNVPDERLYGGDETGFLSGGGNTQQVIGGKGNKVQHQQRSRDRENITIIPTICADGMYLSPVVIYKGSVFQMKWAQENLLGTL